MALGPASERQGWEGSVGRRTGWWMQAGRARRRAALCLVGRSRSTGALTNSGPGVGPRSGRDAGCRRIEFEPVPSPEASPGWPPGMTTQQRGALPVSLMLLSSVLGIAMREWRGSCAPGRGGQSGMARRRCGRMRLRRTSRVPPTETQVYVHRC